MASGSSVTSVKVTRTPRRLHRRPCLRPQGAAPPRVLHTASKFGEPTGRMIGPDSPKEATMTTAPAERSESHATPMPTVGARARRSRQVTSADIERFTAMTGDRNPVHYDSDIARASRFGAIIVQGGVTSGLLNAIVAEQLPGPGSVFLETRWNYLAPVRPGPDDHGRGRGPRIPTGQAGYPPPHHDHRRRRGRRARRRSRRVARPRRGGAHGGSRRPRGRHRGPHRGAGAAVRP